MVAKTTPMIATYCNQSEYKGEYQKKIDVLTLLDSRIYEPFMNEGSVAMRTIDAIFMMILDIGKKDRH